jgi:hypothetical protein
MNVREILAKVSNRLNKSASKDYDNIWKYQVKEAYYKEALALVRRLLKGKTNTGEGDEETTSRIDDLQFLLVTDTLTSKVKGNYNETQKLPSNYLAYKRLSVVVSSDDCSGIEIRSDLKTEADLSSYLDYASLEFEETLHTIKGNRIYVQHNDKFRIDDLVLTYYRLPKKVDFKTLDEVIEFNDSVAELLVDGICRVLAGDMENQNQVALASQRTESII